MRMFFKGNSQVAAQEKTRRDAPSETLSRNFQRITKVCLTTAVVTGLLSTPLASWATPNSAPPPASPTAQPPNTPTRAPIATVTAAPPTVAPITTPPVAITVKPVTTIPPITVPVRMTVTPPPVNACDPVEAPLAPATARDVLQCTILAQATAILYWYGPSIVGKGTDFANTKITQILMKMTGKDKNFIHGLEMIAAALGYEAIPSSWTQMTITEFYNRIIKPMWDSCRKIGADLGSLPGSLSTLATEPTYYRPQPLDGPGVRTGRYCSDMNRGWLNGGYNGCLSCCDSHLTQANGLFSSRPACRAVCNAQFK